MVARRDKTIAEQPELEFDKVGSFYLIRESFHLTAEAEAKSTERWKVDPTELDLQRFAGFVWSSRAFRRSE